MRKGDIIIMDKGYYSYSNYLVGISRFKIVPLIFPRKDFKIKKALSLLSYPLSSFENSKLDENAKSFFEKLAKEFKSKIENWKVFKAIRSSIEDVFKLAKNSFSLDKIHRYTMKSVAKFVSLNVLLVGIVLSLGFNSKEKLQRLAEW